MNSKEARKLIVMLAITGAVLIVFSSIGKTMLNPMYDDKIGNTVFGGVNDISNTDINLNYIPESICVPLEINPAWDGVDQSVDESKMDGNCAIHYSPDNWGMAQWMAQAIHNAGEPMTGFQVLIRWWDGGNNGDLFIGVSKTLTIDTDQWLIGGRLSYTELEPNTWYWVGFDFSDASENPLSSIGKNEQFYIILASMDSLPDDLKDGGWWCWGMNTTNCDDRSFAVTTTDGGESWSQVIDWDMCFKTYTEGGGGSDKPIVSASGTYWVATSTAGMGMLLASIALAGRELLLRRLV